MTHQGLIASLGTSAMLVASAIAILLVVGAIVAFEGFPGPSVEDSSDAFPVQGLPFEAPKPELVPASRARPSDTAAATVTVAASPGASVAATAVPAPPALVPTAPEPPPPEPPPPGPVDPVPPPGGPSGGGPPTLRETLVRTTQALESSVERVVPAAEPVIDALRRLPP